MKPESQIGRLSDLAHAKHRVDWSEVNAQLRALEPGQRLSIRCPDWMKLGAFRSTLLTSGKRFHIGDWVLTTRTQGQVIHCFLSPR